LGYAETSVAFLKNQPAEGGGVAVFYPLYENSSSVPASNPEKVFKQYFCNSKTTFIFLFSQGVRGNGGLGRPVPGPGRGLQLATQKVREPCHQERNQIQLTNFNLAYFFQSNAAL
jgi:hypothetical protein